MMPGSEAVGRAESKRRAWVGAVVVAVVAAAAIQLLLHELFMSANMVVQHVVSGLLQAVVIAVPVVMYVGWRRAAEREAAAARRLRESEALRSDLVNMLIHDLKGPAVTTGLALSALARNEPAGADGAAERNELLQIARDGITRLEHMIGDMLDAATAEADALRLDVADVDLTALVRAAIEDVALHSEERKVRVHGPEQQEAIALQADGQRVLRVMDNLLLNAVKFTPPEGNVEVSVTSDDEEARVTVKDSGVGVPRHLQAHIFDKYRRAEAASGNRMSVGLGLAFCRLIVEAHGGRIWVESEPGRGSAFTFALPLEGPRGAGGEKGGRKWTGKKEPNFLLRI